jgi:hypothetical protein
MGEKFRPAVRAPCLGNGEGKNNIKRRSFVAELICSLKVNVLFGPQFGLVSRPWRRFKQEWVRLLICLF